MKKTPEKYLHQKGYTTYNTSKSKIKAEKGLGQAFVELYYKKLENKDIKGFMDDIIEFHKEETWESEKKKEKKKKDS
jgi:hypothetical protein